MMVFNSLSDSGIYDLLKRGEVGVIPTDTIYGLACIAEDSVAVARLYALKNREHKPGTLIAANVKQLIKLGVDIDTIEKVAHLWPSSISVIVPINTSAAYLDQGLQSLAIRIPKYPEALVRLLEQTGPLMTTSANAPGQPPATNKTQVQQYFSDQIDFFVDGGDMSKTTPSTIVTVEDGVMRVVRQGAVQVLLNTQNEPYSVIPLAQ